MTELQQFIHTTSMMSYLSENMGIYRILNVYLFTRLHIYAYHAHIEIAVEYEKRTQINYTQYYHPFTHSFIDSKHWCIFSHSIDSEIPPSGCIFSHFLVIVNCFCLKYYCADVCLYTNK